MNNLIGVDVDSKLLVCAIQRSGKRFPIASFDSKAAGHHKLIRWATKHGKRARVCLDATGVYSPQFALALRRTQDIEVMVANPKAIKKFGEASLARGKTDAMDAEVILEYLARIPFQVWQPPADEIIELQSITRRIVERRIAALERAALDLVNSVPELKEKLKRLTSVKGIGKTTGLQLLAELSALPPDMKAAQWVAQPALTHLHTSRVRRPTSRGASPRPATAICVRRSTYRHGSPSRPRATSKPSMRSSSSAAKSPWRRSSR